MEPLSLADLRTLEGIPVDKRHIADGVPASPVACPLALALAARSDLALSPIVQVSTDSLILMQPTTPLPPGTDLEDLEDPAIECHTVVRRLGPETSAWIERYDDERPVEPTTLTLGPIVAERTETILLSPEPGECDYER